MSAAAAKPIDPPGPERVQAIPRAGELGRFLSGSMYIYRIGWKARKISRQPDFSGHFYRMLSETASLPPSLQSNATLAREGNAVNAGVNKQPK
jgi:hypothetical protein